MIITQQILVKEEDSCIYQKPKCLRNESVREDDTTATTEKIAMIEFKSVHLYKYLSLLCIQAQSHKS